MQERFSQELANKVREFQAIHSVPVAAELMFLASAAGNEPEAKQAAQLILEHSERIGSKQLVRSARAMLESSSPERIESSSKDFVRHARTLLAIDYGNPVLLIDIAHALTAQRHEKAALRYVRAAVALAPKSRFVLRSAARFYLHIREKELAHDLLRRSPLIASDPWVQASEIAVATVLGRTSTLARRTVRVLMNAKHVGAEATELASAVGTVELLSGSHKKARVIFKHALTHPNDNSLAQAEWFATRLKLVVDERALQTPMSFEANSHNAYRHQQMDAALRHAVSWAKDEPFASRPLDTQCYLLSLQGRYADALTVARIAHDLDGNNLGQILNLLFCKTQAGDLDDAMEEFLRLARRTDLQSYTTQFLANGGALAYAHGDFDHARQLYRRAIRFAQRRGEPATEALARAFFARLATNAGDPQAEAIVQEAVDVVPRLPSSGAIYLVQGLVDTDKRKDLQAIAEARVAKREWHWDAISNTLGVLEP